MKQVKLLVLGHEVNMMGWIMELDSAKCKQNCLYYNYSCKTFSVSLFTTSERDLGQVWELFPGTLDNKKAPSHFLVIKGDVYHQTSGSLSLSKFLFLPSLHLSQAWRLQWEMQLIIRISSLSPPISFLTCNSRFGSFQVDDGEVGRSKDGKVLLLISGVLWMRLMSKVVSMLWNTLLGSSELFPLGTSDWSPPNWIMLPLA